MAVLRCTEPFAFSDKGVERVVRAGDLVDEKDPLVKGRQQWFEPVEETVARVTDRTVRRGRPPGSKNKPKPADAPAAVEDDSKV